VKQSLTCPNCGGFELWSIRTDRRVGAFGLFVCNGCGFAEWYCTPRSLDTGEHRSHCGKCGATPRLRAEEDNYILFICRACGHAQWYTHGRTWDELCTRCRLPHPGLIERVENESSSSVPPVTPQADNQLHFNPIYCQACGLVRWFVLAPQRLREMEDGSIRRLRGPAVRQAPGPYR
jgi:predicted RNA-binding Zn-ribbon protein involved in translation (DUF1610 family)